MRRVKAFLAVLCLLSTLPLVFCSCGECEHSWNDGYVAQAPTLEEKGYRIISCEKCGEQKAEEIARLTHIDHTYSSKWGTDKTHHWLICDIKDCEAVTNKTEHTFVDKFGGGQICQACRYIKEE